MSTAMAKPSAANTGPTTTRIDDGLGPKGSHLSSAER